MLCEWGLKCTCTRNAIDIDIYIKLFTKRTFAVKYILTFILATLR